MGIGAGRLGWMVASNVVIAVLQRISSDDGEPLFLLKGGTYIEQRLGVRARATKDVDTLFRGSFENYLETVDKCLAEPIDNITFQRTEPQLIDVPGKTVKPQRFQIKLAIRGKTWRSITVEVSPNEGSTGVGVERFHVPSLAYFGIHNPATTAGILMDYQVAQKLHACTDPHTEEQPNDRVRDVVDLHLLKQAFYDGVDLSSLAAACKDLFAAREAQANQTGVVSPSIASERPRRSTHPEGLHIRETPKVYSQTQQAELDILEKCCIAAGDRSNNYADKK